MATRTKEVLNLDALAEYLAVSKSTLYKLAQRSGLPGQKVGKQWRFHKAAIEEWLRQHPRLAQATRLPGPSARQTGGRQAAHDTKKGNPR